MSVIQILGILGAVDVEYRRFRADPGWLTGIVAVDAEFALGGN